MRWNRGLWLGVPRSIITIYYLICPPFLPNLRTVRFININKVIFYRTFEFPKFPLELFLRDFISVRLIVFALYNYGTFVEVEIVFGAFGITRSRAGYRVPLETSFDEDDVTHWKWGKENRKKARFGAILATSLPKDSFRGLSPEIYRNFSRGNKTVAGGSS